MRHTLLFLAAFYALAVAAGVRGAYHETPSALDLLLPLALAGSMGWWAVTDARARRRPIPLLSRPWFYLLAGLLVPLYVIDSRRWLGYVWLAVHWVGYHFVANAAQSIAWDAIHGL